MECRQRQGWALHCLPDVTFVDVLGRVQEGTTVVATEHQKIFDCSDVADFLKNDEKLAKLNPLATRKQV